MAGQSPSLAQQQPSRKALSGTLSRKRSCPCAYPDQRIQLLSECTKKTQEKVDTGVCLELLCMNHIPNMTLSKNALSGIVYMLATLQTWLDLLITINTKHLWGN